MLIAYTWNFIKFSYVIQYKNNSFCYKLHSACISTISRLIFTN